MMTPHQLRTVDPAVEPLRAGTAFVSHSGAAKKNIACNFAEFHEVHIFGMLFLLEKLASRISSHVELSLSQHDRGVVAHTKKFQFLFDCGFLIVDGLCGWMFLFFIF